MLRCSSSEKRAVEKSRKIVLQLPLFKVSLSWWIEDALWSPSNTNSRSNDLGGQFWEGKQQKRHLAKRQEAREIPLGFQVVWRTLSLESNHWKPLTFSIFSRVCKSLKKSHFDKLCERSELSKQHWFEWWRYSWMTPLVNFALMDAMMLSNYCLSIQKAKALISMDKIIVDGLQAN